MHRPERAHTYPQPVDKPGDAHVTGCHPRHPGGDAHVTRGVTPASPEPSMNHPLTLPRPLSASTTDRARARLELDGYGWPALTRADFGVNETSRTPRACLSLPPGRIPPGLA